MLRDPRFWISVLVILGALGWDVMIYLVPSHLDPQQVGIITGVLNSGGFILAGQFWLGSSMASKEKDATIATLAKGQKA